MEVLTAYCGLNCSECQAFLATRKNDDGERKKVAETWSKQFGHPIRPEDINCEGCVSGSGIIFNYCRVCEIRKCNQGRNLANCGYCGEYPCAKIGFIVNNVPAAKANLDRIHSSLS